MYPGNENKVADIICIAFIFIYAMGYSLGLGPAAWVYSTEVRTSLFSRMLILESRTGLTHSPFLGVRQQIFPTSVRARGLNFAASGGSIGSILVSQIWPVGNAKFGSGIYFFFMVVNFICVPV